MRGRRGQGFKYVVSAVMAILFMLLIMWIMYPRIWGINKQLTSCDTFCADQCGDIAQGQYKEPKGHSWCQGATWDASKTVYFDHYKKILARADINGASDAKEVPGDKLMLNCCGKTADAELPDYWFAVSEAKSKPDEGGGTGGRRIDVGKPPNIRAFYSGSPLANGYTVTAYSGTAVQLVVQTTGIENKSTTGDIGFALSHAGDLEQYEGTKNHVFCDVQLLDTDGQNIFEREELSSILSEYDLDGLPTAICDYMWEPDGARFGDELPAIVLPSIFTDKTLTLQIMLTKIKGHYDQLQFPLDTKYSIRFRVENPVKIYGLTAAPSKEKNLQLSCEGVDCMQFYATLKNFDQPCEEITVKAGDKPADVVRNQLHSNAIIAQPVSENSNRYSVLLNQEQYSGKYLCAYAVTTDYKVYVRKTTVPIKIDRTPPVVTAIFKPMDMATNVTCYDVDGVPNTKSGCTDEVGYFYINHPVDFVGSLFGMIGMNDAANANRWCPPNKASYAKANSQLIPFFSQADFMVLCVRMEDAAGNEGKDIELVYNAWDILAAIAQDQLGTGGPGTGYFGYG